MTPLKNPESVVPGLDPKYIDPVPVTQKVIEGGYFGEHPEPVAWGTGKVKKHIVFHKMTVVDDRVSPFLIGEDVAF